jgi:hypothetical protein
VTRADRENFAAELAAALGEADLVAPGDPRLVLTTAQRAKAVQDAAQEVQILAHIEGGAQLRGFRIAQALLDAEAELSREYADNVQFAGEAAVVYDHVTDGLLSKPTYEASVVIQAHDDRCHRSCVEDYEDLDEELDALAKAAEHLLEQSTVCDGQALQPALDALRAAVARVRS